jgi:WD40 repeat protein
VLGVSFSPDGKLVATASSDKRALLWSLDTGEPVATVHHDAQVYGARFSPDGDAIATAGWDETVRWSQLSSLLTPSPLPPHEGAVYGVDVSPDGTRIATCSTDGTVRLWDGETGAVVSVLEGHRGDVYGCAFSPDGARLASSGADATVRVWDAHRGAQLREIHGHAGIVYDVAYHPDGRLVSSGLDGHIKLWDGSSGALLRDYVGHEASVFSLALNRSGTLMASASYDGTARLWDVDAGVLLRTHQRDTRFYGVALLDDSTLIAADDEGTLWSAGPEEEHVIGQLGGTVFDVTASPDGNWLAAVSLEGEVEVLDLNEGGTSTSIAGHRRAVNEVAFFPDGERLATVSDDQTVATWRRDTGERLWRGTLLLPRPASVLTHTGWHALATELPAAELRAAAQAARRADSSPDGGVTCLLQPSGELQLWRAGARAFDVRASVAMDQPVALWATRHGCVVDALGTKLLSADGSLSTLETSARPRVVAAGDKEIFVGQPEVIQVFDTALAELRRYGVHAPPTALVDTGQVLLIGFADGTLGRVPAGVDHLALEAAPRIDVTALRLGPMETLAAGFADGTVGLWNRQTGELLRRTRLHGSVRDVVVTGDHLHALSELGDVLSWDLSAFQRDYCELLSEVWRRVPAIWRGGGAVLAPPPEHRCRE